VDSNIVAAARKRIAEINDELKEDPRLKERELLQAIVDFSVQQAPRQLQLVSNIDPSKAKQPPKLRVPDGRRADSNTTLICKAARDIIAALPERKAPYQYVYENLPAKYLGDGNHKREAARTAIKRAGHDFGLRYADSAVFLAEG
jgi:hypothetical protein